MYEHFYSLKQKPFNLTPDSHFLYLSKQHRDALSHLLYGIRERKGFILISGEVGAGKTTLCRSLIREIEREAEVGFILNSFLSERELLKAINEDLFGHSSGRTRKELTDELNRFLLEKHQEGRNVVIIIDESQNLAIPVLEQIRMLSNLETEKNKLLQIIMVGQPEIRSKLETDELRQLAQRISVTYHLQPLDYRETVNYINHRLRVAGNGNRPENTGEAKQGQLRFSRAALKRIFLYSEGVPRKINILCDRALLIGFVDGKRKITDRIARRAIREVESDLRRIRRKTSGRKLSLMWGAVAIAACLAVGIVLFEKARSGDVTAGDTEMVAPSADRTDLSAADPELISVLRETAEEPAAIQPTVPEAEAARLLAKVWGRGEAVAEALPGERDFSRLAELYGMKAIPCWANVDFLRHADLPCILGLGGHPESIGGPVVLREAMSDGAVASSSISESRFFKNEELNRLLMGRVVYFLPDGVDFPVILAPGMEGGDILELQKKLKRLGLMAVDERGVYGNKTIQAVRRLQELYGLPTDGMVGRNENILIYSLLAGDGVPRLTIGPSPKFTKI